MSFATAHPARSAALDHSLPEVVTQASNAYPAAFVSWRNRVPSLPLARWHGHAGRE